MKIFSKIIIPWKSNQYIRLFQVSCPIKKTDKIKIYVWSFNISTQLMKCSLIIQFVFISLYFLISWVGCPPTNPLRATLISDDQRAFIKCGVLLKRSVGQIYEDLKKSLEHKSIAIDRSVEFMPSFRTYRKVYAGKCVLEGQNQL